MVCSIGPIVAKKSAIAKLVGIDDQAIGGNASIHYTYGDAFTSRDGTGQGDAQMILSMAEFEGSVVVIYCTDFHTFSCFCVGQIQHKTVARLFEAQGDFGLPFDAVGIVFEC